MSGLFIVAQLHQETSSLVLLIDCRGILTVSFRSRRRIHTTLQQGSTIHQFLRYAQVTVSHCQTIVPAQATFLSAQWATRAAQVTQHILMHRQPPFHVVVTLR
jgi:hypothetical protein